MNEEAYLLLQDLGNTNTNIIFKKEEWKTENNKYHFNPMGKSTTGSKSQPWKCINMRAKGKFKCFKCLARTREAIERRENNLKMRNQDLDGWTSGKTTYQFMYTVKKEVLKNPFLVETYKVGLITRVWS